MRVYACRIQLFLTAQTLKEKRGIIKSVLARSRNRFNVAAAEVEHHDRKDMAVMAFVTVSESGVQARNLLERLEEWLVEERPDVEVAAVEIEER
ncbi:DUF503 domain-containing protein [Geotalea toluenoxydans]|uniref:DUF503 domain-containing protein n=1 Tax=Geotalea toluenoxydans TaxID=421624 RepID=UPI0006CFB1C0|nr:DUF503 domain-containing protein [Geotalea toluenoxydans]